MKSNCTITNIFSTRRLVGILLIVSIGLVVLSILANLSRGFKSDHYLINEALESYIRLFSLNKELSIPTWYSSTILFISAIILALIFRLVLLLGRPYANHWLFLSLIFLGLSMDETASIHEMAVKPMQMFFHTSGYLYYGWVIPGALFFLIVALAYRKFVWTLPSSTRLLFILSGGIYASGALIFEAVGGKIAETNGKLGLAYTAVNTLEETFEMLGVIIFIYALLRYLTSNFSELYISFGSFSKSESQNEGSNSKNSR